MCWGSCIAHFIRRPGMWRPQNRIFNKLKWKKSVYQITTDEMSFSCVSVGEDLLRQLNYHQLCQKGCNCLMFCGMIISKKEKCNYSVHNIISLQSHTKNLNMSCSPKRETCPSTKQLPIVSELLLVTFVRFLFLSHYISAEMPYELNKLYEQ